MIQLGFEIEYLHPYKTANADIFISVSYNGKECACKALQDVLLIAGSNFFETDLTIMNCPYIPYWNSSPFGGDLPSSEDVGDTHHWRQFMMNPEMGKRIEPFGYDTVHAKFVSEYGYPGPIPKTSLMEYMDKSPVIRGDKIWELHTNIFEKYTVSAGIEKHYGNNSSVLGMDDYILYAHYGIHYS